MLRRLFSSLEWSLSHLVLWDAHCYCSSCYFWGLNKMKESSSFYLSIPNVWRYVAETKRILPSPPCKSLLFNMYKYDFMFIFQPVLHHCTCNDYNFPRNFVMFKVAAYVIILLYPHIPLFYSQTYALTFFFAAACIKQVYSGVVKKTWCFAYGTNKLR